MEAEFDLFQQQAKTNYRLIRGGNQLKTVIYNGKIVTPKRVVTGAIVIDSGIIKAVIPENEFVLSSNQDAEMINADGCYVLPGLVDFHGDMLEHAIQPARKVFFPGQPCFAFHPVTVSSGRYYLDISPGGLCGGTGTQV